MYLNRLKKIATIAMLLGIASTDIWAGGRIVVNGASKRGRMAKPQVFANQESTVRVRPMARRGRAKIKVGWDKAAATTLWQALLAIEASKMNGADGVDVVIHPKLASQFGKAFLLDLFGRGIVAESVEFSQRGGKLDTTPVRKTNVTFEHEPSSSDFLVWGGSSHPGLTDAMATKLKVRGDTISLANHGAASLIIPENPRGKRIYYVLGKDIHDAEIFHAEMLGMLRVASEAKALGASEFVVVSPYLPYSRSDRMDSDGIAVGAAVLPKLMGRMGIGRSVFFSVHQSQETGMFQAAGVMPVHLAGEALLAGRIAATLKANKTVMQNVVVVAPDAGAAKRARVFAKYLAKKIGVNPEQLAGSVRVANKERRGNQTVTQFSDSLTGQVAVVIDDETASGGTLVDLADAARANGAQRIYAAVSHLTGPAHQRIGPDSMDKLFVLDTLPQDQLRAMKHPAIEVVSIADSLGQVVSRLEKGRSIRSFQFLEH